MLWPRCGVCVGPVFFLSWLEEPECRKGKITIAVDVGCHISIVWIVEVRKGMHVCSEFFHSVPSAGLQTAYVCIVNVCECKRLLTMSYTRLGVIA